MEATTDATTDEHALSPAERKALKARAHHLKPVLMIGDAGLTEAVAAEGDRALAAHGLIKVRVLGDDRTRREALMHELCAALRCAPVQSIGKLLVVYRPRADESVDVAAPASKRRRGPHRPKKAAGAVSEARAAGRSGAGRVAAEPSQSRAGKAGPGVSARAGSKTSAGINAKASAGTRPKASTGTSRKASAGSGTRTSTGTGTGRGAAPRAKAGAKSFVTRADAKPAGVRARGKDSAPKKGSTAMATTTKKSLSDKTAGKRTDLHATSKPPARKKQPSKATQGPTHLQGKSGPRTGGRRDRAKGG